MTKSSTVSTSKILEKTTNGYITIGLILPIIIAIGWVLFYIGLDNRKMSTKHFGIMGQMATSWVVLGVAGSSILPEGLSMVILRLFWLAFGVTGLIVSFNGTLKDSASESECIDFISDGSDDGTTEDRCSNIGCPAQ